jgi:cysteine-rich repeat protein
MRHDPYKLYGLLALSVVLMVHFQACQIQSHTVPCGDRTCPTGNTCFGGQCARPAALDACRDVPENQDCTIDGSSGACIAGICSIQVCGNSVVEVGESCDDGNRRAGDGCAADCRSTESCGNGVVDVNESCDCGTSDDTKNNRCEGFNSDDTSSECTTQCVIRSCGDGVKNGLEDCDGADLAGADCQSVGLYGGALTCSSQCRLDVSACQRCGDGIINGPEVCDGSSAGECVDFSGDYGVARCSAICTPILADCGHTDWQLHKSPIDSRFRGGFAFPGGMLFAGNPLAARVDGTTISLIPGIEMTLAVAGISVNDAFFVGKQGRIYHYDGQTASLMDSGSIADFRTVFVSSPTFALAGGADASGAVLLQYDGTQWLPRVLPPGTAPIYSIVGSGPNDLWVGTRYGQVLHFDGAAWEVKGQLIGSDGRATNLRQLLFDANGTLWASGYDQEVFYYDGARFVPTYVGIGRRTNIVFDGKNLFALNANAALWWDGYRWLRLIENLPFPAVRTGGGFGQAWISGPTGKLANLSNYFWHQAPATGLSLMTASWTAPTGELFAGDRLGNLSIAAQGTWRKSSGYDWVTSMWGTSANNVFAAMRSGIVHWDGSAWSSSWSGDQYFRRITGIDASHVYAVSETGIQLWDGTSWTVLDTGIVGVKLYDVQVLSASDVYAVGVYDYQGGAITYTSGKPVVLHFDGNTWSNLARDPLPAGRIKSIVALAPNDIWINGRNTAGAHFRSHYDGNAWSPPTLRAESAQRRMVQWPGNDLISIGSTGAVTIFTNNAWSPLRVPAHDIGIYRHDLSPAGDDGLTFASQDGGVVLRRH